ncbi:hypothetical protein D3C81_2287500 [compost metagenome]
MADGEGHGQHGEAEGEGDAEYTDADGGTGGEYRTATAAKHQPEGAEQLGAHAFTEGHAHESIPQEVERNECASPTA